MLLETLAVPRHEVPVQHVERAGIGTRLLLHVVTAAAAVVAHAVDVGATRDVRLGCHHAAVAPGGHARDIRQRHPFVAVGEAGPEPARECRRCDAEQRREVGLDHQARDVMHAASVTHRAHGVVQAAHLAWRRRGPASVARLAIRRPEPQRQRQPRLQRVRLAQIGHQVPVNAAYVLAPAKQLADETLHTGQRDLPIAIRLLGARDHLARMQQPHVDGGRENRVEHVGMPMLHGVLVRAELRQPLRDETLQHRLGIFARDRQREAVHASPTACPARDALHDRACRLIRRKRHALGHGLALRPCLPVLRIEIPVAARRLAVGLHQDVVLAAHLAVEELHAEFLLLAGPTREFLARGQEPAVGQQFQRDADVVQQRSGAIQRFHHFLLTSFRGDHACRVMLQRRCRNAVGVALRPAVVHAIACRDQRVGKVSHGGENQHQLLPMPWHGRALVHRLDEADDEGVVRRARQLRDGARAFPGRDEHERRAGPDHGRCSSGHAA